MAWWGEEERSAPADSGSWSLVTMGYPGRQPSPPAMWVGPSPRSPEGRDGADRLLSGCPVGNLPPGPLLFPHRPGSCHLWTTSSLLGPLERGGVVLIPLSLSRAALVPKHRPGGRSGEGVHQLPGPSHGADWARGLPGGGMSPPVDRQVPPPRSPSQEASLKTGVRVRHEGRLKREA